MKSFWIECDRARKAICVLGLVTWGGHFSRSVSGILAIERIGFWLELSGFEYLFLIGSFGASFVLFYMEHQWQNFLSHEM